MPDITESYVDLVQVANCLKKYSLLVVDDKKESLEFFSVTMKNFFKYVGIAQDGSIAIDKMNNYPYDVLITDNLMPNISGKELITKMKNGQAVQNELYRNRIENMPILLLTGSLKKDLKDILNFENVNYLYRENFSTKTILEFLVTLYIYFSKKENVSQAK